MTNQKDYKILRGKRIWGYGFPVIIVTIANTPDPNLRLTERFSIFMPDSGKPTLKGDRDGYTKISKECLSDEDIQTSSIDVAKAEFELKLFETRSELQSKGVEIPCNPEFEYAEVTLQEFLALVIRYDMGEICDRISEETYSQQLQRDLNYRLAYQNWSYCTKNIISEPA